MLCRPSRYIIIKSSGEDMNQLVYGILFGVVAGWTHLTFESTTLRSFNSSVSCVPGVTRLRCLHPKWASSSFQCTSCMRAMLSHQIVWYCQIIIIISITTIVIISTTVIIIAIIIIVIIIILITFFPGGFFAPGHLLPSRHDDHDRSS